MLRESASTSTVSFHLFGPGLDARRQEWLFGNPFRNSIRSLPWTASRTLPSGTRIIVDGRNRADLVASSGPAPSCSGPLHHHATTGRPTYFIDQSDLTAAAPRPRGTTDCGKINGSPQRKYRQQANLRLAVTVSSTGSSLGAPPPPSQLLLY